MPKSRLITASLIDSVNWRMTCPKSWTDRAQAQLVNMLSRVHPKPETAQEKADEEKRQHGIMFENKVYHWAQRNEPFEASDNFKWFVEQARGGIFQKKAKRFLVVGDDEYCLYAKLDIFFEDMIKDIKATYNFGGRNKYLDKFQHKFYCYVLLVYRFKYLVAIFQEGKAQIVDKQEIDYICQNAYDLEIEVQEKVKELIAYLQADKTLFDLWTNVYTKL